MTHRQAAGAPPAAGGLWPEPTERVGRRWIALIALANLGLYLAYLGPSAVLLPNQVQAIAVANDAIAGDLFVPVRGSYRNIGKSSGSAFSREGRAHAGMGIDWIISQIRRLGHF